MNQAHQKNLCRRRECKKQTLSFGWLFVSFQLNSGGSLFLLKQFLEQIVIGGNAVIAASGCRRLLRNRLRRRNRIDSVAIFAANLLACVLVWRLKIVAALCAFKNNHIFPFLSMCIRLSSLFFKSLPDIVLCHKSPSFYLNYRKTAIIYVKETLQKSL